MCTASWFLGPFGEHSAFGLPESLSRCSFGFVASSVVILSGLQWRWLRFGCRRTYGNRGRWPTMETSVAGGTAVNMLTFYESLLLQGSN
ncbi:hypothetical protein Dimus_005047 [Dionaea muscipula]